MVSAYTQACEISTLTATPLACNSNSIEFTFEATPGANQYYLLRDTTDDWYVEGETTTTSIVYTYAAGMVSHQFIIYAKTPGSPDLTVKALLKAQGLTLQDLNTNYSVVRADLPPPCPEEPKPSHCRFQPGLPTTTQSFTADKAGCLAIDTNGSDFDTGLAVYTTYQSQELLMACNDNCGTNGKNSAVSFPTAQGSTYQIVVIDKDRSGKTPQVHTQITDGNCPS